VHVSVWPVAVLGLFIYDLGGEEAVCGARCCVVCIWSQISDQKYLWISFLCKFSFRVK
jgi:hypothetical protein